MNSDTGFDRNKIIRKKHKAYDANLISGLTFDMDTYNANYPVNSIINTNIILNFTFVGPKDSLWENKTYNGYFTFPLNFPMSPPSVNFRGNLYHPNLYKDGEVCISILHAGSDSSNYESDAERWTPIHTPMSIMASISLIFHEPNLDSAANVDAAIMYKHNPNGLRKLINGEISFHDVMTETDKIRGNVVKSSYEDGDDGDDEDEN